MRDNSKTGTWETGPLDNVHDTGYTLGDDSHCSLCGIGVEPNRPESRWFFTIPGDRNGYFHTICFGDCLMEIVQEGIRKRYTWAEENGLCDTQPSPTEQ